MLPTGCIYVLYVDLRTNSYYVLLYALLTDWFLGLFAKLRKVTICFVMLVSLSLSLSLSLSVPPSIYPSVGLGKTRLFGKYFLEILYFIIFRKSL